MSTLKVKEAIKILKTCDADAELIVYDPNTGVAFDVEQIQNIGEEAVISRFDNNEIDAHIPIAMMDTDCLKTRRVWAGLCSGDSGDDVILFFHTKPEAFPIKGTSWERPYKKLYPKIKKPMAWPLDKNANHEKVAGEMSIDMFKRIYPNFDLSPYLTKLGALKARFMTELFEVNLHWFWDGNQLLTTV